MRLDVKEEAPWRILRDIDMGKEKQLNLIPCLHPSIFRCGSRGMVNDDSVSTFSVYSWAWVLFFGVPSIIWHTIYAELVCRNNNELSLA